VLVDVGSADLVDPLNRTTRQRVTGTTLCHSLKDRGVYTMSKRLKPGEKAPASGQYEIVGPRGGRTGEERTVVRREPLPPTPKPGQGYKITDRTKNDSGKEK
jgi:hypothetical protein